MDSMQSEYPRLLHLAQHPHIYLPTSEAQYKYRFKKWEWKKNVPATKKAAIVERGQTRAALGKSTIATFQGREVDSKKLRRHAKEALRKEIALKATADRAGSQQSSLFGSVFPFDYFPGTR